MNAVDDHLDVDAHRQHLAVDCALIAPHLAGQHTADLGDDMYGFVNRDVQIGTYGQDGTAADEHAQDEGGAVGVRVVASSP